MEILKFKKEDTENIIKRSGSDVAQVTNIVLDIIKDVQVNKDQALIKYGEKFDKVKLESLKVSEDEIKESYNNLDKSVIEALKGASKNIEKFHKGEIPSEWEMEISEGVSAGQIIRPLNSVGCYIPGGRAAYPSTILMTVIPAKIAGVEKVICCSPPQEDGKITDATIVAADMAGADEIYKVGGAQAIAAMAYGTESISKVEKIVGPGNIFVTAAKKLVYGDVDIDFPAGPSEVLVLADETGVAEYITFDILSQGEHDPNSSCFLVTTSEDLANEVLEIIEREVKNAKRRDIIEESLSKYGKIILVDNMEDGIFLTNEYAPEHLIITSKNNKEILTKINNAGSIFLGNYSPVAGGDYGSGTNHVLPTAGGARMYSGLSTESFIKKPTVQTISEKGLMNLQDIIISLADYEGLFAHSDSVKVRLNKED